MKLLKAFFIFTLVNIFSCARDTKLENNKNFDINPKNISGSLPYVFSKPGDIPTTCETKKDGSIPKTDFIWTYSDKIAELTTKPTSVTFNPASRACLTVGGEYPVKNKKADTPQGENVIVKKIVVIDVSSASEKEISLLGFTNVDEFKLKLEESNKNTKVEKNKNLVALIYVSPKSINVLNDESQTKSPLKIIEPETLSTDDNNHIGKSFKTCQKLPLASAVNGLNPSLINGPQATITVIFPGTKTNCVGVGTYIDSKYKCNNKPECSKKYYVEKIELKNMALLTPEDAIASGFLDLQSLTTFLFEKIDELESLGVKDDFTFVSMIKLKK